VKSGRECVIVMRRRSFLKAAGAVAPAALLERLALGQNGGGASGVGPVSGEAHVVGQGEDRFGEHHPLGFTTILFRVGTKESGGSLFAIEHRGLGKGGPPEHLHLYQDEWFYVLEGKVRFRVGGKETVVGPGESVLGPRMVPHCFAGTGEKPARMLITCTPAGKMEEFFRAVAVPNGPKMDAALFARYEMQYVGPGIVG
jgi:mannose-6-phosphate isomerase-like protein (cupin superfamily)